MGTHPSWLLRVCRMQPSLLIPSPQTRESPPPNTVPSGAELLTTSPTSALLPLCCCLFLFLLLYSSGIPLLTMPLFLGRHPFSLCPYNSTLIPLSRPYLLSCLNFGQSCLLCEELSRNLLATDSGMCCSLCVRAKSLQSCPILCDPAP